MRDLQSEIPEQQFNTWIRPLQAVEDDGVLRLLAPNRFVVDWLEEHYIDRILELVDGAGESAQVVVEVGSRQAATPASAPSAATTAAPKSEAMHTRCIMDACFKLEEDEWGVRGSVYEGGGAPGRLPGGSTCEQRKQHGHEPDVLLH